jgi:HAD superfamily hydrolase (TIGR01509 family)
MGTSSPLRGVLLDIDGTLIDSNDAHAQSWHEALKEFGRDIPAGTVRPLIGMGGDKLLPRLLGVDAESDVGKAFSERRAAIFLERYVPGLRPTPGAKDLVRHLKAAGLRVVIATSAREEEMNPMLEQVGLDDLVTQKTTSDDAERSKPDPDIVRAALAQGKLAPAETIMLGDTPYDVEAARRAGVRTVAFRSGGWDAKALAGAVAVYDDPAHLLREFTASPFASAT